jgi:hypothetical protein
MSNPTRREFLAVGAMAWAAKLAAASGDDRPLRMRAAEADQLITQQIERGEVAAAALLVRRGDFEFTRGYG